MSDEQNVTEQVQENAPVFSVEKLYLKDLSLEVPHAPRIFLEQEVPEVDMKIAAASSKIEDGFYECSVTATVTAKLAEKVVFLTEVTQAGIFHLDSIPEEDIKVLLGIACPNILFPYVREVVSSTVTRAGFPPVLLSPINFEALYQQSAENPAQ